MMNTIQHYKSITRPTGYRPIFSYYGRMGEGNQHSVVGIVWFRVIESKEEEEEEEGARYLHYLGSWITKQINVFIQ